MSIAQTGWEARQQSNYEAPAYYQAPVINVPRYYQEPMTREEPVNYDFNLVDQVPVEQYHYVERVPYQPSRLVPVASQPAPRQRFTLVGQDTTSWLIIGGILIAAIIAYLLYVLFRRPVVAASTNTITSSQPTNTISNSPASYDVADFNGQPTQVLF